MRTKIRRFRYRHSLWRSLTWNRGYYAAMQERPEHDARHEAWVDFLQHYYYDHKNHHSKAEL